MRLEKVVIFFRIHIMSKDWIDEIISAWTGHREFAEFLVKHKNPNVVVELGVDYGFSTFVFANALQNTNGIIYGIDLFEGDIHTGLRNTYDSVIENIKLHKLSNIHIINNDFNEESKIWSKPIDILHIDGLHTYNAVKNDFEKWSKFLQNDGIILFHDIISFPEVRQFFREIHSEWHKLYFTHSAGLGIITKNIELKDVIINNFLNVIDFKKNPL